jgi:hypothetical protein
MYKSKKILAFVPARAGSKRIKGKNNIKKGDLKQDACPCSKSLLFK